MNIRLAVGAWAPRFGESGSRGWLVQAAAILVAFGLFGLFLAFQGKSPLAVYGDLFVGSFGSAFAWQNTLVRAAPLMLTALCTLIPAHLGLVVIGNEGAWLLGGLAAAALATPAASLPPFVALPLMLLGAAVVGGAWIGLAGLGKQLRGVDPTISSLLLYYVALGLFLFLVEGPLRDPASLNKPSTKSLAESLFIGPLPGTSVHPGIVVGVVACVGTWFLFKHTRWGFKARIAGGNDRVAASLGLPRTALVVGATAIAGACAGLAGGIEIAAVQRSANAALNAGVGTAGILVAFLARQNALALIPVAVLLGGIQAAGGLIQRRHDVPDATVAVFQGILFLSVLLSEAFRRGREEKR